ncbi:hypothetical protein OBBRIDRAFT_356083 [Obba rivulosa]|uniref:Heterokaryon incompatibility domain-containing protein n=1 Tax=Obba rivulosa TaxID=1052685 RepID=A0A8E2DGL4_9APHY|nr:hypothetical protein OBBRIDRAFT_356083 [Obba rivulosa]
MRRVRFCRGRWAHPEAPGSRESRIVTGSAPLASSVDHAATVGGSGSEPQIPDRTVTGSEADTCDRASVRVLTETASPGHTPPSIAEVYDESFEAFKHEFRECLHKLVAHLSDMPWATNCADIASRPQEICSVLSRLEIFDLPFIDSIPECPREIQDTLVQCLHFYQGLPVLATELPRSAQADFFIYFPVHRTTTMKLFQQLFDILGKEYASSTRHTAILTSIAIPAISKMSNEDLASNPPSDLVLWRYNPQSNSARDFRALHGATADTDVASHLKTSFHATIMAEDAVWLGGQHDGFELCSLSDYLDLRLAEAPRRSALAMAAAIQSQLTFGLLEAVTREKIPESLLLQRRTGAAFVVTTRNLYPIIYRWASSVAILKDTDAGEHYLRCEDARRTLWYARDILDMSVLGIGANALANFSFRKAGVDAEDVAKIARSICIIGEALTAAGEELLDFPSGSGSLSLDWTFVKSGSDCCHDLTVAGWCPSVASKLSRYTCSLEYANIATPTSPDGPNRADHRHCSIKVCEASTIDPTTYSNRHVVESCKCAYSTPPLDTVLDILSNNQIPLITVGDTENGNVVELICLSAADARPYVAISHVWADGLGSTTEKGLPTCQVRRLSTLAHKVVPGGAFWLDGLCIPAQSEMRKRAIRLMGRTYEEAQVVLVLDSGIRSCSIRAPIKERLLRVVTSGWTQRMWTLQEASLAKKLAFEFADGLMSCHELYSTGYGVRFDPAARFLTMELGQLVKSIPALRFAYVSNALQSRTTSKPDDETLAVAGLFHVDALQLVVAGPEERMRLLLLKIREIPSEVIFLQGPKLSTPGFRWAPRSLMRSGGGPIIKVDSDATCTPDGLLATCFAIRFDKTRFSKGESWWLEGLVTGKAYQIVDDGTPTEYTCNALLPRKELSPVPTGVSMCRTNSHDNNTRPL